MDVELISQQNRDVFAKKSEVEHSIETLGSQFPETMAVKTLSHVLFDLAVCNFFTNVVLRYKVAVIKNSVFL